MSRRVGQFSKRALVVLVRWIITEHQNDFALDVDIRVVVVTVVLGGNAVAGKHDLALSPIGCRKPERNPIVVERRWRFSTQRQAAGLFHSDADRDIKTLQIAATVAARLQAVLDKFTGDVISGKSDARGIDAPAGELFGGLVFRMSA